MDIKRLRYPLILLIALTILPVGAQDDAPPAATFDFTIHDASPLITPGADDEWNALWVGIPNVFEHDGTYYMVYGGAPNTSTPASVGVASSPDGINWTPYADNPVFSNDGGNPPFWYAGMVDHEGNFVIYYSAAPVGRAADQYIWRATAPALEGPYVRDPDPALVGNENGWDHNIVPLGVQPVEDGYILTYMGFNYINKFAQPGMAFSADGYTFVPHDDPTTTGELYANSDPIVRLGETGEWDSVSMPATNIVLHEDYMDIFYLGFNRVPGQSAREDIWIGYARSNADGTQWTKYTPEQGAINTHEEGWPGITALVIDGEYYIYYGSNLGRDGIFLMTGTIEE